MTAPSGGRPWSHDARFKSNPACPMSPGFGDIGDDNLLRVNRAGARTERNRDTLSPIAAVHHGEAPLAKN
jgi:hypothetical protein